MSLSKLLRRHDTLRWDHAALILTAALLLANWQLLAGRVFERADGYNFFSPYYSLIADFARAGRLLLWNPWTHGGSLILPSRSSVHSRRFLSFSA